MQPPPSTPSRGIGMGDGTVQGATILGGGTGQGATISTPSGLQGAPILGGGTGQGATPSGTPSTPSFRTMGTGGTTTTAPPPPPPRSKHYGIKYHWFRSKLKAESGSIFNSIELKKVATENQLADLFTKGLGSNIFIKLRGSILGW